MCVPAQAIDLLSDYDAAVEVLKLLAEPTRLRLLRLLMDGDRCVADLAAAVGAAAPAVSQHLARLRRGGLVASRRDGNRIFYRTINEHVEALVNEALLQADHLVGGASHHGTGDI